jgi:hypothetical protein
VAVVAIARIRRSNPDGANGASRRWAAVCGCFTDAGAAARTDPTNLLLPDGTIVPTAVLPVRRTLTPNSEIVCELNTTTKREASEPSGFDGYTTDYLALLKDAPY